jgi:tetratricopeptide (TPR) repeat protein
MIQFCLASLPTSGIVPFGYLDKTFVADHFLYLPSWGFWLAFFGLLEHLFSLRRRVPSKAARAEPSPWRSPVLACALGMSAICLPLTVAEARNWSDSEVFWNHVLSRAPDSWLAYGNRGQLYTTQGRLAEALQDLEKAVRLKPGYVEARFNLAYVLDRLGRTADAAAAYGETIRLSPLHPDAHNNLGILYLRLGDLAGARRELETAVSLEPGNSSFVQNLRRLEAAERRAAGAPQAPDRGTPGN